MKTVRINSESKIEREWTITDHKTSINIHSVWPGPGHYKYKIMRSFKLEFSGVLNISAKFGFLIIFVKILNISQRIKKFVFVVAVWSAK